MGVRGWRVKLGMGSGGGGGRDTHVYRKYFSCSCNHVPSSPLRLTCTYTLYNYYTLIYSALHNLAKSNSHVSIGNKNNRPTISITNYTHINETKIPQFYTLA